MAADGFDAVTAALGGHERDRLRSASTWAPHSVARPPSGASHRRARGQGATKRASSAEHDEHRCRQRGRRLGAPIRATPNTVAAMRKGMIAATLWYRGSVIDRKSESPFASSCGSATAASPGDSTKQEQEREPEQEQVRDVLSAPTRRRGDRLPDR